MIFFDVDAFYGPPQLTAHCSAVDCVWGPWSSFSTCSLSCGGGEQRTSRLGYGMRRPRCQILIFQAAPAPSNALLRTMEPPATDLALKRSLATPILAVRTAYSPSSPTRWPLIPDIHSCGLRLGPLVSIWCLLCRLRRRYPDSPASDSI